MYPLTNSRTDFQGRLRLDGCAARADAIGFPRHLEALAGLYRVGRLFRRDISPSDPSPIKSTFTLEHMTNYAPPLPTGRENSVIFVSCSISIYCRARGEHRCRHAPPLCSNSEWIQWLYFARLDADEMTVMLLFEGGSRLCIGV
jgi:hypothetical protein